MLFIISIVLNSNLDSVVHEHLRRDASTRFSTMMAFLFIWLIKQYWPLDSDYMLLYVEFQPHNLTFRLFMYSKQASVNNDLKWMFLLWTSTTQYLGKNSPSQNYKPKKQDK